MVSTPLYVPLLSNPHGVPAWVYPDLAAGFASASTQYLSVASAAGLVMGVGVDYTWACWGYLTDKSNQKTFVGKYDALSNGAEYLICYRQSQDRFSFNVTTDGNDNNGQHTVSNLLGSPALNTWYFIVAQQDTTSGVIKISVNNGGWNAVAIANTFAGASQLKFGAFDQTPGSLLDGRMDCCGLWRRKLTDAEITTLYNGGTGSAYHDLSGTLLNNLEAYYDFDDASAAATWVDRTGNHSLTNHGSVTSVVGKR